MKEPRKIIGLGYRARSGKDTVAKMLAKSLGRKAMVMAFADPLKAATKAIFSWTDEHVHGEKKEELDEFWGFTPRHALQVLGTECVRKHFGDDTWVRHALRRIAESTRHVIVTDVRFPNEADMIRSLGGEVWCIDREETYTDSTHASETAMRGYTFDRVISNNGTLEALQGNVLQAFERARFGH